MGLRKIAAIVVNINGVTGYQINPDGAYGECLLPFQAVKSVTEAAERLHERGYGIEYRLDVCLAGTRISSMVYVGMSQGAGRWQESEFTSLRGFPRYPHPLAIHTGAERFAQAV